MARRSRLTGRVLPAKPRKAVKATPSTPTGVAVLRAQLDALVARMASMEQLQHSHLAQISELQQLVAVQDDRLDQHEVRMANNHEGTSVRISKLGSQVMEIKDDLADATKEIRRVDETSQTRMTQVEEKIASERKRSDHINAFMNTTNQTLNKWSARMADRITEAEGSLNAATKNIAVMNTSITNNHEDLKVLNESVTNHHTDIVAISEELASNRPAFVEFLKQVDIARMQLEQPSAAAAAATAPTDDGVVSTSAPASAPTDEGVVSVSV